jgi:hypothetical protein
VSDFLDDPCAQSKNRFCSQPFDISAGIADFMERAFNAFSDTVQPVVKSFAILQELILALGCPYLVIGLFVNSKLPFSAEEAFRLNARAFDNEESFQLVQQVIINVGN